MSRATLSLVAVAALGALATGAAPLDSHLDPERVPGSCSACHRGHGARRSPMLPGPQLEVCLSCHGSVSRRQRAGRTGLVPSSARPTSLSSVLSKPFTHPVSDTAFSSHESDVVTCTSCHSPHRSPRSSAGSGQQAGSPRASPRNPSELEFQLCTSCHGGRRSRGRRAPNASGRYGASNRSFHPLQAPSVGDSPSVRPELAGRQVNCTDCHGNDDPAGVKGPHGSNVRYILSAEYATVDGSEESPAAYALCYRCHDRASVLDSPDFPEHRRHVVEQRASCATCHDPHASEQNRALIRFGDPGILKRLSPSGYRGRLAFESRSPGSGACYLTCHGYDHAPATYGTALTPLPALIEDPASAGPATSPLPRRGSPRRRRSD